MLRIYRSIVATLIVVCGISSPASSFGQSTTGPSPAPPWTEASFDACRGDLAGHLIQSPLVQQALARFARDPILKGQRILLNATYDPRAINVIVPDDGVTSWPSTCGDDAPYPTCWSHPNLKQVICNPLFGRLARLGADLGENSISKPGPSARYTIRVVLGHELGHIIDEPTATLSHAFPDWTRRGRSLRCFAGDASTRQRERDADAVGTRLACAATKASEHLTGWDVVDNIALSVSLRRLFRMEFQGDDLCVGSSAYESMDTRIEKFAAAFVACNVPGSDVAHTFALVEARQRAVEAVVTAAQVQGWVSSPSFWLSSPKLQRVALADGHRTYLTVEFTGFGRSEVLVGHIDAGDRMTWRLLGSWPDASHIGRLRREPSGWSGTLVNAGESDVSLVPFAVTCANLEDVGSCALQAEASISLASTGADSAGDVEIGADGSLAVTVNDAMTWFRRPEDVSSGGAGQRVPSVGSRHQYIVAGRQRILLAEDASKRIIITDLAKASSTLLPMDALAHALHRDAVHLAAAEVSDTSLMIYVRDEDDSSPAGLLICPSGLLAGQAVDCQVFRAPRETHTLRLTNTNLGSFSRGERTRIDMPLPGCSNTVSMTDRNVTWVVRPGDGTQTVAPTLGTLGCEDNDLLTYRFSRIDRLHLPWTAAPSDTVRVNGLSPSH